MIRPIDILKALINNDLTSEGGYLDQAKSGSLDNGNYVSPDARALNGIDPSTGAGALDAYSSYVASGGKLSGETQEAFNNLMSTEATHNAQNFEEHMRDTDLLSSASQLSNIGLSPSTLSGATAHHSGVNAANVGNGNPAQARYNQKMELAQSLISMAGHMASSGIYGASRIAVKKMAGAVATSAAHSGLSVSKQLRMPKPVSDKEWNSLFEDDDASSTSFGDDWLPF